MLHLRKSVNPFTLLMIFSLLLVVLLLAIVSAYPVSAQEPTSPPTTAMITPTAPLPTSDDTITLPSWVLVNLSVLLIAASALVALVTVWMNNRNLKYTLEHASKANKDAVEAAYEALPETAQDAISRVLTTVETLVDQFGAAVAFLREVTDGQPNTELPTEAPDEAAPPQIPG